MKLSLSSLLLGSLLLACCWLWTGINPVAAQKSQEPVANLRALDNEAWALRTINPQKAQQIAEKALGLARELNDREREASLCNTLGCIFLTERNFEISKTYLEQSLQVRKTLGLNKESGNSLHNLGKLHLEFEKYEAAKNYFQRAIYTYQALDDAPAVAACRLLLGTTFYKSSQWEKAQKQAFLAHQHYAHFGLDQKTGGTENLLGLIALRQADNQGAIHYFQLAIQHFQQSGDRNWEALATSHLALAHQNAMQPIDAARYHQIAANLLSGLPSNTPPAEATYLAHNSGLQLHQRGELEAAVRSYQRALENAERHRQHQLAARTCHNLAAVYDQLQRKEEATRYRFRLKSLMESIDDNELTAANYLGLAQYYQEQKKWKDALEYYKRSKKAAVAGHFNEAELKACRGLYDSYKHLNRAEDALLIHERLLQLQEQLLTTQMEQLNAHHENIHHQNRVKRIKTELQGIQRKLLIAHNEVEHLRSKTENLNADNEALVAEKSSLESDLDLLSQDMYLMVIYGLVATLLSVVLLMRYFYKRREFIRLSHQKQQIDAKNDRISKLLQELNHRVKNNQQFFSSLLYQLARQLSDLQARQAIRDGLKRVDAIAQLHKKLYEGQEFQVIEMANYISDLTHELDRSYRAPGQSVSIGLSLQEMPLEVDLAVSVGLIVNELLTNAYKHAFSPERTGSLHVSLQELNGDLVELTVGDNGAGLPKDFELIAGSFGFQLVQDLVAEIDGHLEWDSNNGAFFRILFYKSQDANPDFSNVPPHTITPLKQAS
ncbi:MAG: tetratricopeptide repeat protein [Salibacteraceae bacterium]